MNVKVFNDAVHGTIELHPLCVKFIDTPQFQRLRFIKQLGLGYFVYHAAAHNRFEHCLGVCYLAGQFARSLKEHQPELKITDKDILCIEIAGLCHDLGHGPFSHLWEIFMKRVKPQSHWKHEKASVAMFEYLIKVNQLEKQIQSYDLDANDLVFIKELISKPATKSDCDWPYKGRTKEKGFLYQIVANNENGVDVDKWDYFLRDGHSLGLQVTFDYSRLIKFSRVINVSETNSPEFKICYRDKEMMNLYDMFHTRMMLHKKAYQHRVTKTLDTMLLDALILANDFVTFQGEQSTDIRLCDVVDDLSAMTYLNDDVFHIIHRNTSPNENMKKAKQIIHNILTRRYYPYVGHTVPTTNDLKEGDLVQKIMENLPSNSLLKADDLDVQLIIINYGNGNENPVLRVGFFCKNEPDSCKDHRPEDVFMMLPNKFEEKTFRIVCRNYDASLLEDAKYAFVKTCEELQIPKSQGTPWNNTASTKYTSSLDHNDGKGIPIENGMAKYMKMDNNFNTVPSAEGHLNKN